MAIFCIAYFEKIPLTLTVINTINQIIGKRYYEIIIVSCDSTGLLASCTGVADKQLTKSVTKN